MSRRAVTACGWRLAACASLAAAALGPFAAHGQSPAVSASRQEGSLPAALMDWEAAKAKVELGLEFLRSRQQKSGAMGSQYPVAATSLAGLAILGTGLHPRQPPHGATLQKCLDYLEKVAEGAPVSARGFISEAENQSRMHGHSYAVLFLCELLGAMPGYEDRIIALIRPAVGVIEQAQSTEGGWFYYPNNTEDKDEASVTVCALQALRAARNVGFSVDAKKVDLAIKYVKRCQQPDGSFAYSLTEPHRTTYALSVAAISTLNAAGVYRSPELQRGLAYLGKALGAARSPWKAAEAEHDFYANLYAAQAYYQDSGALWDRWYAGARQYLLDKQRADGAWESPYGDEFATAVALLILEVPLGYLPIFQR